MKRYYANKKLNNRGAALVMVIVVIAFISISATILLYMSAMNFYMKTTDIKNKGSFYEEEKALEEIKASLMQQASEAAKVAYVKVMPLYGVYDPATMQSKFNEEFINQFKTLWRAKVTTDAPADVKTYLLTLMDTKYADADRLKVEAPAGSSFACTFDTTNGKFLLQTVNLEFTDSKGYITIISTDFVVQAPTVNFGMDPTSDAAKAGETIELVKYVTYSNWTKK